MRRAAIVGLAIVLGVAGCTGDPASPAPMPSTAMPSAPVASAAEPPAAVVETRAVDAAGDRLTMTMTPLVRRGGAVVMTVHTRLDATRGRGSSVVTRHFSTILATSFDDVRLVDETGRRVYPVATGPGGRCVCTGSQRLSVGDEAPLQAVFTGVPAEVTRLSVMLPYAGVFAGVPVTAGDVPPAAEPLDPASAGASAAADLDAHTERLDVPLRTRRTPDRVDLSIDADVLFRLDSAELTSGAGRTVDAAVRDLRAAGPGPLTVTGHTDDSGTAAHNQALSEGRARTVAAALAEALPAGQWPVTVAGRGEAEPAVPNTSAANRRLNRRVTVSYRAARTPTPAAQTTAPQTPAARAALPPAEGVVGTAADGVEIALPLGRGTVRFVPGAARLRGPFLQVDLVARNVGDDPATILDLLGQGVFTARDEFDPYAPYGASGVRLLDGVTTAHGLDYVTADGGHRCLCDRLLNVAIPPGSERVIALWFPAPAPGTTTVALDVPGRFRLTGVPVT